MENKISYTFIFVSLFLIGLTTWAFFVPFSLNWGFNFLGFLPSWYFIIYIMLALLVFTLFFSGQFEHLTTAGALQIEKKPSRFLVIAVGIFGVFAIVFRDETTVLGDSFTLIYNFRDYANGISYLAPWNEPLSIYFLYYSVKLIGSLDYPQIFKSFFIIQIILGSGFILTIFFIVKNIFQSFARQFLAFIFIVTLPFLEFFFGYIEVYSVSTLLLSIFILVSILSTQKKIPFYIVPIAWLLVTLSHYINGLLGLGMLYQSYLEIKQKNLREVLIGFGLVVLIIIPIALAINFEPERIINISPISHFLSLTNNIDEYNFYSQAYTIFSPYHFIDIFNYIIMMCPFAFLMIILGVSKWGKNRFFEKSLNVWFLLLLVPIGIYYFLAKLEQGNASDWDAFAAQFIIFNLFAVMIFLQTEYPNRTKIFALIVSVSLLQSLAWFSINVPAERNIARFLSLWDKRNLSHMGNYTHALRLYRYYDSRHDSINQISVWKKYTDLYPDDPRSYINTLEALNKFTPEDYASKIDVFKRWINVDPANDSLKTALASVYLSAGNRYFAMTKYDSAKFFYTAAITLDANQPKTYNNLGSVFAVEGKLDSAILYFSNAIKRDSVYAEAYYNIGTAYIDNGDNKRGKEFYNIAARLGNLQAKNYLSKLK